MVKRRLLAVFLVFSVPLWASFARTVATATQPSSIGSFYGGYHRVSLTTKEKTSLQLKLDFRTANYESGLLFLALQSNHSGYLAAGLRDGQLEIVLKRETLSPQLLHSFTLSFQDTSPPPSNWHSLSLQYFQSQLTVTLDTNSSHSQNLSLEEGFSDVYFSGVDSFLYHPLFRDLHLAQFFTGCLSDVKVDDNPVLFDSDHQNGIGTDCCLIPITPIWCFQYSHSSLSIPIYLHDNLSIQISFQLQAVADGLVLSAGLSPNQSLYLRLSGNNLTLVISDSQNGHTQSVQCPALPTRVDWHHVEVQLTTESARCSVGEQVSDISAEISLSTTTELLNLGGAQVQGVSHASFEGCLKEFEINSAEVRPSLGNQLMQSNNNDQQVDWSDLNFDLNPLTVDAGDRIRLTAQNINMTLPEDFFTNDMAFLYQQAMEDAIHITAIDGPYQGSFVVGQSNRAVKEFAYQMLTSQDNETQIFYQHSATMENVTDDVITIQVSVDCGGDRRVFFNGTLEITIVDNMVTTSPATVKENEPMMLAAGTLRVITSEHLTVEIEGRNGDPSKVTFGLQGIEPLAGGCEEACDEPRGKLIKTYNPNLKVMFFSQQEVNDGNISFQHFEKFGTEPVVIKLIASVDGGSISVSIDVYPYEGTISFLSHADNCLFVKEGSAAVLGPEHLNTTTDFEDQDPSVSYDLVGEPKYGYFERFIDYHDIYPDWHPLESANSTTGRRQITDLNFFTQEDVDNGHVRYVHNHSLIASLIADVEQVRFRLRSTNLTGALASLCIHVVAEAILVQPKITIVTENVVVDERESVIIGRNLLTTTTSLSEAPISSAVDIHVEQMGIVYSLTEVPLYGQLKLNETVLSVGDNFTFENVSLNLLSYEHGGSEDHNDSFEIFAVATTTSTLLILTPDPSPPVTVNISVTPINNHLPQLDLNRQPIQPPEGGYVIVTEENINVTDSDRPNEVLTIYIRKKGESPIGHFAFKDSPYDQVNRFTMEDVSAEQIIFMHKLNTSASLTQTQVIRLDDGSRDHYVRERIDITAIPLNLTVELRDSNCLASIDAILELPTVLINHTSFSIMLRDHFGEDRNLVPEVNVTILSLPLYGQFNKRETGGETGEQNITSFTVLDLLEDKIEYSLGVQNSTERDWFTWRFQYGNSVVGPFQLSICISPIPIPRIVYTKNATVTIGGMVNLDDSYLLAEDNHGRRNTNDTLVYEIITPPKNGSIVDQRADVINSNLSNFTQTDINNQRVIYQNRDSDVTRSIRDSFTFRVCTLYACTAPREFFIHVRYNNLTVLNTGFSVLEGGKKYITTSELNIFAPEGSRNLRFYVNSNSQPKHGNLTLKTITEIVGVQFFDLGDVESNNIFYQNDGAENLHDSFEFTATADYQNTDDLLTFSGMVNITIIPVNDNPPELVKFITGLDAVSDGSTLIPPSRISAHDYDSDMRDEDILWRLVSGTPLIGYMYLDVDRGRENSISNWTEGELRAGRVFYRNDAIGESDALLYTITDGYHVVDQQFLPITLQPILFERQGMAEFELMEGENLTISASYLSYYAKNDDSLLDKDILYTILSVPVYGHLLLRTETLRIGNIFSQQDIRDGLLMYVHDHSNSELDGFNYSLAVSNRANTSAMPYWFKIKIIPIDDDPPVVTYIQDPLFVLELSHVLINGTVLTIDDHDSVNDIDFNRIVCTIVDAPRYGLLPKQRFGNYYINSRDFTKYDVVHNQVWYNHTSYGHYEDGFTFRINDSINSQNEIYSVRIVILPSVINIRANNITVEEGQTVHIERTDFVIDHAYLNEAPGYFLVIRHPTSGMLKNVVTERNITEFTTTDLSNDIIVYEHNGKEIVSDYFEFLYEALEPEGLKRKSSLQTVFVNINLVNDEPPIFVRDRVLADIISGQAVVLNERYLNVSDSDTPPSGLNYTFTLHIRGHISYSNDTATNIYSFTHTDVIAGRVIFVHEMDLNGDIQFNVTDGKQYAIATLSISTTVLELTCNQEEWSNVSLAAGGEVLLTRDHLNCNIFTYNVVGPITFSMSTPRHGVITVGGEIRNNFTMEEVRRRVVTYSHTDFDYWEEEERLDGVVTSDFVEPFHFQLQIGIRYQRSNTSQLAVNSGLRVDEGGRKCINQTNLDVRNLRYFAWLGVQSSSHLPVRSSPKEVYPVFDLTRLPEHGQLFVNSRIISVLPAVFTHSDIMQSAVCYEHDDSETTADSIQFHLYFSLDPNDHSDRVTFSGNQTFLNSVRESIAINISPINDERPEVVTATNLSLVLGFPVNLTNNELSVTDRDSPASSVQFTLLNPPQHARLTLGGRLLELNDVFSQADINDQRVSITPLASTSEPDRIMLSFRDERDVPTPKMVTVNFTISEHRLELVAGGEVRYQQNVQEVTITTAQLDTKTNGHRSETQFSIVSGPTNGRIDFGVREASQFSQTDVDEGRVKYIPTSTTAYKDKLTLRAVNKGKFLTVNISFTSLAWGSVKEDARINFTSDDLSRPLPSDLLNLEPAKPPEIRVIDKPRYGALVVGPVRQQGDNSFTFHYDDLTSGRVKYEWDYDQPVYEDTVVDNFTMLVLVNGMPPGQVVAYLTVQPPKVHRTVPATQSPTTNHQRETQQEPVSQTGDDNGGFPLFSLFPILGIFFILVITIVIIVLFCTTQQKRIRKWPQPGVTRPPVQRNYPWSVDPHAAASPGPMAPPNYSFDPASQSGDSDNEGHNSETSSGFSEPVSPRHSPVQSCYPPLRQQQNSQQSMSRPMYGTPMSLGPPRTRSRARSNVSITFSSRQSVMSDVSVDDSPQFYSHSLPRPLEEGGVAVPTPVRPASHSAFTRVPRPPNVIESGYNSEMFRGPDDSGVPSRAGSCAGYDDEYDLPPFPSADVEERLSSAMLPTLSCASDAGPGPVELKSSLAIGEDILNLNDPNLIQKLRSPNPVLRKEEYWV